MTSPLTEPDSEVPWGRPPLPEIPVPPFESLEHHLHFVRCLAVHVTASGAVPLQRNDMVLLTLLQDEADSIRWTGASWPRELSPLVLRVALRSYFPAPWTPRSLADAVQASGGRSGEPITARGQVVAWGSDPTFGATRQDDGSWKVTRSERGSSRLYAELPDDDALVLLLLAHQRAFAFPLGTRTDGVPVERLVESASRGVDSWSRHARLPYLAHVTELVQRVRLSLGAGPGEGVGPPG